jgi:hypothetical protein
MVAPPSRPLTGALPPPLGRCSGPRDAELAERVTAVDEEAGVWPGGHGDTPQDALTGSGMASIEGANADGEHDVEGLIVCLQQEVFGRDPPDAHAARGDLVDRGGFGLRDSDRGSIDGQDVAGGESGRYRSCGRPGPAPDLEDAGMRLEWQGVHDRGEAGRQTGWQESVIHFG